MFDGYLCIAGNEVANNARLVGYATTADCPIPWKLGEVCANFSDIMGEGQYVAANINEAPWYDDTDERTSRFLGNFVLSIENIVDSTRTAQVTESILSGGTVGRVRAATRSIRVRSILIADGADALDYGMHWLGAALAAQECTSTGVSCGGTDLTFFAACPQFDMSEQEISNLQRFMHNVTVVSGPLIQQTLHRTGQRTWAYIVEWTMVAATPFMFGPTKILPDSTLTSGGIYQDAPLNLLPKPSAEVPGDDVVIARNYSQNPSLETNATGWATSISAVSGSSPAALWTGGRNVGIAAQGSAAYRGLLTGVSGGSNLSGTANARIYQTVDLTALGAGVEVSLHIWGRVGTLVGASTNMLQMRAWGQWLNASDVAVGSEFDIGTTITSDPAMLAGQAFSLRTQEAPVGATKIRVGVDFRFVWNSGPGLGTPSNIPVYVDTLAVTIP